MDSNINGFNDHLKNTGYSLTNQRQLVFNFLVGQEPVSMNELIQRLKNKLDRASIYRTIILFEKLGIVHKLNIGWKYKIELTDMFAEHHHHLTCLNCSNVIPINQNKLENFIKNIGGEYNFQVQSHIIEMQGLCKACFDYKNMKHSSAPA
ncbi:MAG TPA: Fur family transcriptional regulator [Patescibacteria group bacterium]|nr:Fur family transcriptional regulator [Patescibacteria group bacterium]